MVEELVDHMIQFKIQILHAEIRMLHMVVTLVIMVEIPYSVHHHLIALN